MSQADLYKAYWEYYDKYIYFLLAAAGAAIAFAVTQTQTATISLAKILLLISVVCWGVSFFCGCRQILENSKMLKENYDLLTIAQGRHPQFPPDPRAIQQKVNFLVDQAKKTGWGIWQFRFFIAGACVYIAWHVIEMYLRTSAMAEQLIWH